MRGWHVRVISSRLVAKQEAFEEKTRLKNQFRALDEDEVDFLDSVLESTRAQEAAVKKETADQLEIFRKQREEAEKAMLGPTSSEVTPAEEEWTISARKRRRDKGKDLLLPGKKRKASTEGSGKANSSEEDSQKPSQGSGPAARKDSAPSTHSATTSSGITGPKSAETSPSQEKSSINKPAPAKPASTSLGLVGYGSDSDSE